MQNLLYSNSFIPSLILFTIIFLITIFSNLLSIYIFEKYNIQKYIKFENVPIIKPPKSFAVLSLLKIYFVATVGLLFIWIIASSVNLHSLYVFGFGTIFTPMLILFFRPIISIFSYRLLTSQKPPQNPLSHTQAQISKQSAFEFFNFALFSTFVYIYNPSTYWIGAIYGCVLIGIVHLRLSKKAKNK